jgi:C-terminal processing protease CtpA/Prc
VKDGSRAENSGLKLGDSIVTINNVDTSNMTLQEANNVLEQASQHDVKLGVVK